MIKTKVAVIGSGMAGLTAAIYLKRANCDFVLISDDGFGGKLKDLKEIENFPAVKKTSGEDLLKSLEEQIKNLGISSLKGNVQTILMEQDGFDVVCDFTKVIAKKVILATGGGNVIPLIKGEDEFLGNGVSYCAVCDGNFFKGLDVAVIGSGEDVINEALYLSNIVKKVYFISPRGAELKQTSLLKSKANIEVIENAVVSEITGNTLGVTGIVVNGNTIDVSGVFPFYGKKSSTQILSNLNPSMTGNFINVNENMETNIKGLYAAGDIVNKKLRQLITAANDGAIAAINASKDL